MLDGRNQRTYSYGFCGPFVELSIQSSYSKFTDLYRKGTTKCSMGWHIYDLPGQG